MTAEKTKMKLVTSADGESLNIVQENIKRLKVLFPDAFTEDGINFETLRQLLGDANVLDEGEEKFGLNWHGKKKARQIALTPSTGTLRPCQNESVDWDNTKNIFIEGDNLEALKLLRRSYAGKIKMIYIDPPYNTGKEFVYPDNYQDNLDTYLRYTGQKGEDGLKFTSNTENSGRKHTNWLNMIYPRLKIARDLLAIDGVIFISIDDNEQSNLRELCDEIFGENNFLTQIIVQSNKRGQTYKEIAKCHEYILVYYKSEDASIGELEKVSGSLPFEDEEGGYDLWELRNRNPKFGRHNRPNLYYPIYINPNSLTDEGLVSISLEKSTEFSVTVFPKNSEGEDSCWRWGKDKVIKDGLKEGNIVIWGKQKRDGGWNIYEKSRKSTTRAKSIWLDNAVISEQGTVESGKLDMGGVLEFPKPVELIKRCVMLATSEDDIVLDFFAGSGTTAHAVMLQNCEDSQNRRSILIQLPEPTYEIVDGKMVAKKNSPLAFKQGFKTIADVSRERIKRAAKSILKEHPKYVGDLGFKAFKLDSSNIKAWNPDKANLEETLISNQEHLIEGRTEQDILYELLIKRGVDLAIPIQNKKVSGKNIFSIGHGVLFACLDESIAKSEVEAIAQGILDWHRELNPESETHVFFRDSAFKDDIAKTNMAAILEQNGISHVRSL
jgi:adenine-specific DNA-methyltransferase